MGGRGVGIATIRVSVRVRMRGFMRPRLRGDKVWSSGHECQTVVAR